MNNNNNNSFYFGRFNPDFMDSMSCMAFAIGLMNLKENLQQSKNNDIIDQIGKNTNKMIVTIEKDLEDQNTILDYQNKVLFDIIKRLEKLEQKQKESQR